MTRDASAPSEGCGFPWAQRECGFTVQSYTVRTSCLKHNERDMKLEPHGVVN